MKIYERNDTGPKNVNFKQALYRMANRMKDTKKNLSRYRWCTLGTAILLAVAFSSCSSQNSGGFSEIKKNEQYSVTDEDFDSQLKSTSEFIQIAENNKLRLYLNGATAEIAVQNKANDKMWYSNPYNRAEDTIAKGNNMDELNAQLKLSYVINDKMDSMNNYTESIANGQFDFVKLDNGVRINFRIGTKPITYLVPKVLSVERFENIRAKADDEGKALMEQFYNYVSMETISGSDVALYTNAFPIIHERPIYFFADVTNPNAPPAGDFIMSKMEKVFISTGYTQQDLDADNTENKTVVDKQQNPYVEVSVEYTIVRDGLRVRVPKDSFDYDRSYMHLTELQLLPFFGAMDMSADGYIFVPDGSGALIHLNNQKIDYEPYKKIVYGEDAAIPGKKLVSEEESQIYLPVFGMKEKNNAFYAVIEQGDAAAFINADISGRVNQYNSVNASYLLIGSGVEENTLMSASGITSYQKKPLDSDIIVGYYFLSGDEADYSGMARGYQNYLLENELLPQKKQSKKLNFHFSAIGSVPYKTTFLGIPYESQKQLTGYSQAIELLQALKEAGVSTIDFQYKAWANGGSNHTEFSKLNYISSLGGKKGFQELANYIKSNDITFYPEIDFQYACSSPFYDMFDAKKNGARTVTNSLGYVYDYSLSDLIADEDSKRLIISPGAFEKIADSFIKDYQKLEIQNMSLGKMGFMLNSDFNEKSTYDRESAKKAVVSLMKQLSDRGYHLAVDGANAYTWKYAARIDSVPSSSGENYLFDRSIPFMQMVLHGVLPYSSEPLNQKNDYQVDVLKVAEEGATPSFQWIYENNFQLYGTDTDHYGVSYKEWFKQAVTLYNEMQTLFDGLEDRKIFRHTMLTEDVFMTEYDTGTKLFFNYGENAVEIEGQKIDSFQYLRWDKQ